MFKPAGLLSGLLLLGSSFFYAAPAKGSDQAIRNVTSTLYVFDSLGEVDTIDDVSSPDNEGRFKAIGSKDLHLGYTKEAYWFRLEVENSSAVDALTLELNNSQLLSVTLYSPAGDGSYSAETVGVTRPFWERPIVALTPSFPLEVTGATSTTFYLRVQHYGALRFRAYVGPSSPMREKAMGWIALNILLAGALLGLAIYHVAIWAGLRQEVYLWLALFLFSIALNQMTFSGIANMLLWKEPSIWANHALTFTGVLCLGLGMCFSMCFLRAWKHAVALARLASVVIVTGTLCGFLSLAGYPAVLYGVLAYVVLAPCLLVAMAVKTAKQDSVPIGLFLLSWGFVMIGEIMFASVYLEILPDNAFTMNFMHVAALGAAVIWSFSLTRQIRTRAAQQRALLEKQVGERTAQLEKALKDVKTLQGFLPVCSNCKMIRDDEGAWHPMEEYVMRHTEASFSHGICPGCATELYPKYFPPVET